MLDRSSWVSPPVTWTVYGILKSGAILLMNWPPEPSWEKSGQSGKFCARKARSLRALPAGSAGLKKGLVVESFELNEYLLMARSVWLMYTSL